MAPQSSPPSQPSRVVSLQDLLKKGWTCPICETPAPQFHRKCPRCSGLMALDDLQALAENRGVDEKLLHSALENWTRKVTAEPTFEGWLNLARVYFNLNRSAEALPCLNKALEIRAEERLEEQDRQMWDAGGGGACEWRGGRSGASGQGSDPDSRARLQRDETAEDGGIVRHTSRRLA